MPAWGVTSSLYLPPLPPASSRHLSMWIVELRIHVTRALAYLFMYIVIVLCHVLPYLKQNSLTSIQDYKLDAENYFPKKLIHLHAIGNIVYRSTDR